MTDETPGRGRPSDAGFPIGASLARGAYVISERLFGERARGVYRAISRWDFDQRGVLVTLTTRQLRPHAELTAALALPVDGIARLRYIGPVEGTPGQGHDGMVEEEPAGEPLSRLDLPMSPAVARDLIRQIAAILARLHATGGALGCLEPELLYAVVGERGPRLTGIAPRALAFAAGAEPPRYALGPLFAHSYDAPEQILSGQVDAASDVFSLCALAAHWVSGRHPYEGDWAGLEMLAIAADRRRPPAGPEGWAELLAAGLHPDPVGRMTLPVLLDRLDALG